MLVKKLENAGRVFCPPETQRLKAGYVILQPGGKMKQHSTNNKEEILIILEGKATVITEEEKEIGKGECVFFPMQTMHEVVNNSKERVSYLYVVSLGE